MCAFICGRMLSREIFRAGYLSVLPGDLVKKHLKVVDGELLLVNEGLKYRLNRNVYVASFGKASLGMASAAQELLAPHIVRGIVSTPIGSQESLLRNGFREMIPKLGKGWEIIEGAKDNLPDSKSAKAAEKIREMAETLDSDSILLALVSGGGSSLLPCPLSGISLEEKQRTIKILGDAGVSIYQLNTVRQHLSRLKGGGLASIAHPAFVIGLLFSDLMTDDPEFIASGPTISPSTSAQDALRILRSIPNQAQIPTKILDTLQSCEPKPEDLPSFARNVVIGNSELALKSAAEKAEALGFKASVVRKDLSGEARECGVYFARLLNDILMGKTEGKVLEFCAKQPRICLIWGGETTVSVRGSGLGGRNQELVLAFLLELSRAVPKAGEFEFLSAGTDGQDGPTDAAGATVTQEDFLSETQDAEASLSNNDSFHFWTNYKGGKCYFRTGMTGTNVMDLQIMLIKR